MKKTTNFIQQYFKKSNLWFTVVISLLPVVIFSLTQIIGSFVFNFIFSSLNLHHTALSILTIFFTLLFSAVTTIFTIVKILPKFNPKFKTSREELGLAGLPTWTDVLLAPIAFVATLIISIVAIALFSLLPFFDANQAQSLGVSGVLVGFERILGFLAFAVIPPIAEEIIFRGWIYGKLRSRLSFWSAMIIVSVLFAVLHGQFNVAVNVFVVSAVACGLREITGTIWAGIIVHSIKNGIAFLLQFVSPIMVPALLVLFGNLW